MKIVTVIGARPQFIKAALMSKALKKIGVQEILINTGQHYDYNMSKRMFEDLDMEEPCYDLGIGSMKQVEQVAAMMEKIAPILAKENPDMVLVYGDTNSTLAGALAAAKMNIKLAHIEAGLRSFDNSMPEEINRIITDRVSSILFCPTQTAFKNLKKEGIAEGVYNVGDVMYELAVNMASKSAGNTLLLNSLGIEPKQYILVTVHRSATTDSKDRMFSIVKSLCKIKDTVVFPMHPRTRKMLRQFSLYKKLKESKNIKILEPVGYLDMILLEKNAKKIITDSGGVQKEAYFFKVPCITLRDSTEWPETLGGGWNRLVGTDWKNITAETRSHRAPSAYRSHYGNGTTSTQIAAIIKGALKKNGK